METLLKRKRHTQWHMWVYKKSITGNGTHNDSLMWVYKKSITVLPLVRGKG